MHLQLQYFFYYLIKVKYYKICLKKNNLFDFFYLKFNN